MTYFGFLILFLIIPLAVLLVRTAWQIHQKSNAGFSTWRAMWIAIGLHVLLALVYTTPWDNYLVATKVWGYDPRLVSGLVVGWVPVEEYTFFILETLLTGLIWVFLSQRIPQPVNFKPSKTIRNLSLFFAVTFWLVSLVIILYGWKPGTYLALILVWVLPAITPQLIFGADILWHHRKLIALTIFPLFIYLSGTDAIAIASGIWNINPAQSTGIFIGNLPLEEAVFFLATVSLITFGLTLALSPTAQTRWKTWLSQTLKPQPIQE